MKNELNVGTIQMTCQDNQHENQLKIEAKIKELVDKNIDLVVLQELHDCLYFCQTEDIQQFKPDKVFCFENKDVVEECFKLKKKCVALTTKEDETFKENVLFLEVKCCWNLLFSDVYRLPG